jgi:hypothetical protein
MAELLTLRDTTVIPAMSVASIAKVERLTEMSLRHLPQYPFVTKHRLHAGIYTRTVDFEAPPPGHAHAPTGVLIKRATVLILYGDAIVYMGEDEAPLHVSGLTELQGSAGRKQAFLFNGPLTMKMLFATNAQTVAEAQAEFTDEVELLWPLSDTERHDIIVTGE